MCFLYFCLQGQYEDCIEFETHVSLVIVYLFLLLMPSNSFNSMASSFMLLRCIFIKSVFLLINLVSNCLHIVSSSSQNVLQIKSYTIGIGFNGVGTN